MKIPVRPVFYLLICGSVLFFIACSQTNLDKQKTFLDESCISKVSTKPFSPTKKESACQRRESPLQRAERLRDTQGDILIAIENVVEYLQNHRESQEAREILIQLRTVKIDIIILEIDRALQQKDSYTIWKYVKEFQHLEELVKDYAPVPEVILQYVHTSPEIIQAVKKAEKVLDRNGESASTSEGTSEFQAPTEFEWNYQNNNLISFCLTPRSRITFPTTDYQTETVCVPFNLSTAPSTQKRSGPFFEGFTKTLQVFCQNDMGPCKDRYIVPAQENPP